MPTKTAPAILRLSHARMRQWDKNRAYYYTHKKEFLKKYRGKHIAIHHGEVLDCDTDREKLFERIIRNHRNSPVFISHVTEKPLTYFIGSPRIVREPLSPLERRRLRARHTRTMNIFNKNRAYYYRHKGRLLKKYRGKYIAIWNEEVIGVDKNLESLNEISYGLFGNKPIFFTKASERPETVRFPSINVVHKLPAVR